jgi:hypothetical protein
MIYWQWLTSHWKWLYNYCDGCFFEFRGRRYLQQSANEFLRFGHILTERPFSRRFVIIRGSFKEI